MIKDVTKRVFAELSVELIQSMSVTDICDLVISDMMALDPSFKSFPTSRRHKNNKMFIYIYQVVYRAYNNCEDSPRTRSQTQVSQPLTLLFRTNRTRSSKSTHQAEG